MKYKKYRELIEKKLINNFYTDELICIFNEYCAYCNMGDDIILTKDELFDYIETLTPIEALMKGMYGEFSLRDDYFTFNGYGNIISVYAHEHITKYYLTDLACFILDNEESFGYDELQELIDEYWYSEDDLSDYN